MQVQWPPAKAAFMLLAAAHLFTPMQSPVDFGSSCRDYAPYLGISSALKMWSALGPERCRAYMHQLLREAVELLTSAWGTAPLVSLGMCASMACVGLPKELAAQVPATSADAKHIQVCTYPCNVATSFPLTGCADHVRTPYHMLAGFTPLPVPY